MALALGDLPDDVAALKAMLLAARAENASLANENLRFKTQNERYAHILRTLRRAHFGRSSEKISEDQLNLALDDVQAAFAVEDAKAEKNNEIIKRDAIAKRRANRGHLPAHLPREEIIVDPPSKACPCCGGELHVIGEDRSERLDKVPAKYRVIVTRRPKYACRQCERTGADGAVEIGQPKRQRETAGIIQAPAPARLIEGGLPTEALVADVVVSKYAWHLPLYRQAQMMAAEGIEIDRSTLAHWVGFAAF
jgi:transposase